MDSYVHFVRTVWMQFVVYWFVCMCTKEDRKKLTSHALWASITPFEHLQSTFCRETVCGVRIVITCPKRG